MSGRTPAPPSVVRRVAGYVAAAAAILAAAVLLAFFACLAPTVQRTLVTKALASSGGEKIELGNVRAGLFGVSVDNIRFARAGLRVEAGTLRIAFDPLRMIAARPFAVVSCVGRDLDVSCDLDVPANSAGPPGGPTAQETGGSTQRVLSPVFNGLLKSLRIPVTIDGVSLQGGLKLRRGDLPVANGSWSITGGGIGRASKGFFEYTLEVSLPQVAAARPVLTRGTITIAEDSGGEVDAFSVHGDLSLPGPPASPAASSFDLSIARTREGESYRAAVAIGGGGTTELEGAFSAAASTLSGRLRLESDPAGAVRWIGASEAECGVRANVDFNANLRAGVSETKIACDVTAAHLERSVPDLAAIGAVQGHLEASLHGDGNAWSLLSGSLAVRVPGSSAALRVQSLGTLALWPWKRPEAAIASIGVSRLPLSWTEPMLRPRGISLGASEINAEWKVALTADTAELTPTQPLAIPGLQVSGRGIPQLIPVSLRLSPQIQLSAARVGMKVDDFHLETTKGDSIDLKLAASVSKDGVVECKGSIDGELPTLLAGPAEPIPFIVTARWDARRDPASLTLRALQFAARPTLKAPPYLSLRLAQTLKLGTADFLPQLGAVDRVDLADFTAHAFPLGWLSRWLPGRALGGTFSEGASVIRYERQRGLVLATTTPWRANAITVSIGGREVFRGDAALSPAGVQGPQETSLTLDPVDIRDTLGDRLRGRVRLEGFGPDYYAKADVALSADLPSLPGSERTFGALHATLSASADVESLTKSELDTLNFRLTTVGGESLVSVEQDAPVVLERTANFEWLADSAKPLRFAVGRIPLSWLNPHLSARGFVAGGTLQPSSMALSISPRVFRLAGSNPLAVSDFHLEKDGRVLVDRGSVQVRTAVDLNITHTLLPVVHLDYGLGVSLTYGVAAEGNTTLSRFDTALEIGGSESQSSLRKASGGIWVDLGAFGRLPLLAGSRLPAQGEAHVEFANDPKKTQVIEFRGWVANLKGRDGREAPSLDWVARAGADVEKREGGFKIEATLHSIPRPSDATFSLKLDAEHLQILQFASRFQSQYMDMDAVRDFAAAFAFSADRAPDAAGSGGAERAPSAIPPPKPAQTQVVATGIRTAPSGASGAHRIEAPVSPQGPVWSPIQGTFTLEIGTLAFAPYAIQKVGGKLEVTDKAFALKDLSGEMWGGRWGGDAAVEYTEAGAGPLYGFSAHFSAQRLDVGKALADAFPRETAKVDGRLDFSLGLTSSAPRIQDLMDQATGDFSIESRDGILRLTLPSSDMASSLLVLGGAITFSPELRALGRLVAQLSNVPYERCSASGHLDVNGEVTLDNFSLDSPQLRLTANGRVANAKTRDVLRQPIALRANLAAKQDLAVILGGMKLLKEAGKDGFRPLNEEFSLGGAVGQPDLHPLYDFLSRAVSGSRGTWGLLMRQVQEQIAKRALEKPLP